MGNRKERISARVRVAVTLMVESGLSRAEAAAKAGITDHGLYQALRRPLVQAMRNEQMHMLRTSAASRTIARAEKLADNAKSEHVQLQANTWIAGIAGIVPPERVEGHFTHDHELLGLQIEFKHRSTPDLIEDLRAGAAKFPHLLDEFPGLRPILMGNGQPMPEPVPHPARVAAAKLAKGGEE